jgi:putative glutamine amidotransferase
MQVFIGITTSFEDESQSLRRDYVRAVEDAGAVPLILPMGESADTVRALARQMDGLIITGGPAITEGLIGTLPEEIAATDTVRSASDRQYLGAMLDAGKPILGICYGMQLLNAHAGGTIYADVERQLDGALVHSHKRDGTTHPLRLTAGTHLRRLLGTDVLDINTRHLQAIADLGNGFRVSATAPDGVIEAIESPDGTILGVQFHPERMGASMQPLFQHLVECARRTAASETAPATPASTAE